MNTAKNFNERKNQLIQLLSIGMPVAIIMAYFEISNSTCTKYIKKLRESQDWNEENTPFLKSIDRVIKALVLTGKYKPDMGIIEPQRLRAAIEKVMEFKRILEILKISINSIYKLTFSEFSSEVPSGYRKLIRAILKEEDKIYFLRDGEEEKVFLNYLSAGKNLQIGDTIDTWFYPSIDNIIQEYVRDLRNSIYPIFGADVIERVEYILSEITPKEAEILKKYFGIAGEQKGFDVIAAELELDWIRVYQIYKKAIRRCQKRTDFLFQATPLPTSSPTTSPTLPLPVVTSTPIEQLDLSIRALNILKSGNVQTVEELVKLKKADFLKFRNIGKKSMNEIETALAKNNLKPSN